MEIRLKIFKDTDEAPQTGTQLPLQPHLCPPGVLSAGFTHRSCCQHLNTPKPPSN